MAKKVLPAAREGLSCTIAIIAAMIISFLIFNLMQLDVSENQFLQEEA